ncbi:heat shock 70 kda protein 6 [Quercus suber]|uniref:Heat shock 70 kDa protein 6 n=1 Tax=Quercus suber TaxID=58331 RepID=A0AAW0JCD8_QUESU
MLQVDGMVNEVENFAKGRQGKEGCHRHREQANSLDKENVEAKVNEVKDTISSGSTQAIKEAMAVLNQETMSFSLFYGTSKANFKSFANIAYALVTLSEKPVKPMVPGGCHLLVSIVVYAISQALE